MEAIKTRRSYVTIRIFPETHKRLKLKAAKSMIPITELVELMSHSASFTKNETNQE